MPLNLRKIAKAKPKMTKARRTALGFTTIGVAGFSMLGAMLVSHFVFAVPFHDKYGYTYTGWEAFWHMSPLALGAGVFAFRGVALLIRNKI